MSDDRPWYREPETFIAVAALIVSLTAVIVGIYEAELQRAHDRAEVWPHLEVGTYTSPKGVSIVLQNSGIGPAVVKAVVVTVDGKPMHDWDEALSTLFGRSTSSDENYTAANGALRAGDKLTLVGVVSSKIPKPGFSAYGPRVVVRVCYASVFDDDWQLTGHIWGTDEWQAVKSCPTQPKGVNF